MAISELEPRLYLPNAGTIVVGTNTRYGDFSLPNGERLVGDTAGIRGDLFLGMVESTLGMGVRVVVADAGSNSVFLNELERFRYQGLTLVPAPPGRAPQRRAAFRATAALPNVDVIGYVQAEKDLSPYLTLITDPLLNGLADFVIPRRDPKIFEQTYPPYMRASELRVNHIYDRLLQDAGLMREDQSFDWFFGPYFFVNTPDNLELVLRRYSVIGPLRNSILGPRPNPEAHSGSHYFPLIEALYRGKRVVSVEIPYSYPQSQMDNELSPERIGEFRKRRLLDGIVYPLETIYLVEFLNCNSKRKIRLDAQAD